MEEARARASSKTSRHGALFVVIGVGYMALSYGLTAMLSLRGSMLGTCATILPVFAVALTKVWVYIEAPFLAAARNTAYDHEIAANDRFSIVTLNLFLRPPGIAHTHSDFKDERLAEFIARVLEPRTFDVICLQEVFALGSFRRVRLIRAALRCGYHALQGNAPRAFNVTAVGDGLLVLSRHPILASSLHQFQAGAHEDVYAQKGVLHVRLALHGGPLELDIFNTHLQAAYSLADTVAHSVQLLQLAELQGFIRAVRTDAGTQAERPQQQVPLRPALLVGDLNIDATGRKWGTGMHAALQTRLPEFEDLLALDCAAAGRAEGDLPPTCLGMYTDSGDVACSTASMCVRCSGSEALRGLHPVAERIDYVMLAHGAAGEAAKGAMAHLRTAVECFEVAPEASANIRRLSDHSAVVSVFSTASR